LGHILDRHDVFAPVREHVQLGGQTLPHEPHQTWLAVVVSVRADGASLTQINTRLRPDTALAAAWGREGCADQSAMTRVLDAFTPLPVAPLRTASARLDRRAGPAWRPPVAQELWRVDIDLTGLPAGRRAEARTKSSCRGKTPPGAPTVLRQGPARPCKRGVPGRSRHPDEPGLLTPHRGRHGAGAGPDAGTAAADCAAARRRLWPRGPPQLGPRARGPSAGSRVPWQTGERLRPGRAAIAAEIKADNGGLPRHRRRQQRLAAQEALVFLTDCAPNLLAWTRGWMLRNSPVAEAGIYRMVKELWPIPGQVTVQGGPLVELRLQASHPRARPMLACLTRLFDQCGTPGMLRKS
jgi:hypothetical protein